MYSNQVNVISVQKCNYTPGYCVPRHSHDFFHMFYILEGNGTIGINKEMHQVSRWQLYLCTPFCEHEIICARTAFMKTIEVKFFIHDQGLFMDFKDICGGINMNTTSIKNILESTFEEAMNESYLYRDIININMITILLKILKNKALAMKEDFLSADDTPASNIYKGIDFTNIIRFIQENINSTLTLDTLAKFVGLNSTYFCRIFKEKYNISPIQYINNFRLKRAKELLMESDMNITEIAEAVGFQSLHYFSRYFREKEQLSPLEFKQRIRNNAYIYLEKKYFADMGQ